jgi:hypothetical protein
MSGKSKQTQPKVGSLEIDSLQPYHARHELNVPNPEIESLFVERKIAFHWKDVPFTCKEAYTDSSGKSTDDLNAFHRVTREGGIVTAQYEEFTEDYWLCGYVKPGTAIKPQKFTHPERGSGYLKTVQLEGAVEVPIDKNPKMKESKPQRGTLRRWQSNPEFPREFLRERSPHLG